MRFGACRIFVRKLVHCINDIATESGIHGLRNAVNSRLHPLERLFWLIMVLMALFGAGYVSWFQFRRYDGNPIVISLERDYRAWNSTLPAVTLCYKNRLNKDLANEFILRKWNANETDDDYFYFLQFMSDIVNASVDNYESIAQYSRDERVAEVDIFELFQAVEPFQQDVATYDDDISIDMQTLMTERGMCYSINSLIPNVVNNSETLRNPLKHPITCHYGKHECILELHLTDSDAVAVLHSPYEAFSIELEVIDISKTNEVQAFYKVEEAVASHSLRDLNIEQRNCLFPDEKYAGMPVYSKAICVMNCRIDGALSLCNCVPFFYPFSEGPFCTATGMACLQDFNWPVWSLNICECPQKCVNSEYTLNQVIKRKWAASMSKTNNVSALAPRPKSTIKFEVIPPTKRIRRSVLFSFEDLLVSFGGAVGLFLGFSVWSVSKVPYVVLKHAFSEIVYLSSAKQSSATRKPTARRD